MREATIPIASVSGAVVRSPRWRLGRARRLILTAADLRAFEGLTGPGGLELAHPAQLVLDVRKQDKDAARELATQVELAIGDHALRIAEGDDAAATPVLAGEQAGRKLLTGRRVSRRGRAHKRLRFPRSSPSPGLPARPRLRPAAPVSNWMVIRWGRKFLNDSADALVPVLRAT